MTSRKLLLKFSMALLIFNFLLGGLAIFNHWQSQKEIAKAREEKMLEEKVLGTTNIPIFDKNKVMQDATFSSTRAFPTQQSVQNYLDQINSPLKNYTTQGKRASYWIFAAARGQTSSKAGVVPNINPGVILAYLQKEQSLLTLSSYDTHNDPQNRIRKAMGYGCPDSSVCDTKYYGFVNQVNWAAYQLQYNYNSAKSTSSTTAYKVNNTIATLDEYNVFLSNAATAAQYRYTPHVYWGNYNLWKIITANGWGADSTTYKMSDLDSINLADKDTVVDIPNLPTIDATDVYYILRDNYYLGQSNDNIKTLQQFLRQEGYYMKREITGMYGVVTRDALEDYRKDFGIITGTPSSTCINLINKNWTIGTVSNDVKTLQQCLRDLGVFTYPVNTGYFGPVTQESLDAARKALQNPDSAPENYCEILYNKSWTIGTRSNDVKKLQDCLTDEGYFKWKYGSTGYYGQVTETALNEYKNAQQENEPEAEEPTETKTACQILYDKNWAIGTRNNDVKKLQDCLTDEGYFKWKYGSTGYYGQVTETALNEYKNAEQESEQEAEEQQPEEEKTSCEILRDKTWVMGTRSEEVRRLQDCMTDLGYFKWKYGSTGYFGQVTQDALDAWRNANGSQEPLTYCDTLKESDWKMGERSKRVKDLQDCMTTAGTFKWKYGSTGYFGEVTKAALIEWRGYF